MRWPIHFLDPGNLYFLLPVALLIVAGLILKWYWSRSFDEFFPGEGILVSNLSSKRACWRGSLLALAFLGMVIASADPAFQGNSRSSNIMALVDISQSMWCEDYREDGLPRSRLDIAKRNLLSLLDALPGDSRLGLAVIAGAYESVLIITPPTKVGNSYDDLKTMIQSIDFSWTWTDGTNIVQSLIYLGGILEKQREKYGNQLTLVILTDGETSPTFQTHAQLDPRPFSGVRFYFAGHGTTEGAPIPEFDGQWKLKGYRKDYHGIPIICRLDEEFLKNQARALKGTYRRITGGSDLKVLARSNEFQHGEYLTQVHLDWAFWLGSFISIVLFLII